MRPLDVVFEDDKAKIVYFGKRKRTFKKERIWECIFLCFMRDFMGRKWSSGKIYIAKELVDDTEFNYLDFIVECSEERMKRGIKYILDEN